MLILPQTFKRIVNPSENRLIFTPYCIKVAFHSEGMCIAISVFGYSVGCRNENVVHSPNAPVTMERAEDSDSLALLLIFMCFIGIAYFTGKCILRYRMQRARIGPHSAVSVVPLPDKSWC